MGQTVYELLSKFRNLVGNMRESSSEKNSLSNPGSQENIRCDNAVELINELRSHPDRSKAFRSRPYQWAYRGQADAKWNLIPSALRPGTSLGYYPDRRTFQSDGCGSDSDQMNAELIAIRQFAELSDRIGLRVPGFHSIYRQDGLDLGEHGVSGVGGQLGLAEWPRPEMLELVGVDGLSSA